MSKRDKGKGPEPKVADFKFVNFPFRVDTTVYYRTAEEKARAKEAARHDPGPPLPHQWEGSTLVVDGKRIPLTEGDTVVYKGVRYRKPNVQRFDKAHVYINGERVTEAKVADFKFVNFPSGGDPFGKIRGTATTPDGWGTFHETVVEEQRRRTEKAVNDAIQDGLFGNLDPHTPPTWWGYTETSNDPVDAVHTARHVLPLPKTEAIKRAKEVRTMLGHIEDYPLLFEPFESEGTVGVTYLAPGHKGPSVYAMDLVGAPQGWSSLNIIHRILNAILKTP